VAKSVAPQEGHEKLFLIFCREIGAEHLGQLEAIVVGAFCAARTLVVGTRFGNWRQVRLRNSAG
jgi:hypothetical protein